MNKHLNLAIESFLGAMFLIVFAKCSIDHNYTSVRIGTQEWMIENLNVDEFRNGDPILEAKSESEWKKAGNDGKPAWCYYNNDPSNGKKYGKLYNWFAVNDSRGLAPEGWHVPSDSEWSTLTDFLGNETTSGTKIKSANGWLEDGNGTNESGFSGLPGGCCDFKGVFNYIGSFGFWWSSSEYNSFKGMLMNLNIYNFVAKVLENKESGASIRCLRDSPKVGSTNDSVNNIVVYKYRSVKFGKQEWMTENLNVDKFRNGDPILEAKTHLEWEKAGNTGKPVWCYYENDPANGKIYGKLYNWFAVNDPRGLAPEGWHVPSDGEWRVLTEYLGGKEIIDITKSKNVFWYTARAGGKMKSKGTQYWNSPNKNATNSSGFLGFPGGLRSYVGYFGGVGSYGTWWSSSGSNSNEAWIRTLSCNLGDVNRASFNKETGLSVRCLND